MKKIRLLCLCLLLLCLTPLAACHSAGEQPDGIIIVTTIFPLYDFAQQIIADEGHVTILLAPGTESHSYEPTAQDVRRIGQCDLFLYIGGPSDAWVERILGSNQLSNRQALALINCVTPLTADDEEEETENHDEPYDEHIWTSPANAILMTGAICDRLGELFPDLAAVFAANAAAYIGQLQQLDQDFFALATAIDNPILVFGDRFPFLYFAERYGFNYYAAYHGCGSEAEPSAASIARLTDIVKDQQVTTVFKIELSSDRIAKSIAKANHAQVLTLNSCHNLSKKELTDGATYLALMRENLKTLRQAFGLASV